METVNSKVTMQMVVIIRKPFPERQEIRLTADITELTKRVDVDTLAQLAFDIERTLNEYLPQIRVHNGINVETKDDQLK